MFLLGKGEHVTTDLLLLQLRFIYLFIQLLPLNDKKETTTTTIYKEVVRHTQQSMAPN